MNKSQPHSYISPQFVENPKQIKIMDSEIRLTWLIPILLLTDVVIFSKILMIFGFLNCKIMII